MPSPNDLSKITLAVIKGLVGAVSTSRLYFPDHPHVSEKIKEVYKTLQGAFAATGTVVIVRLSDEIIAGGKPLRSKDGMVQKFCAELFRCGISQVTFRAGLELDELRQWVGEICAVTSTPLIRSSAHLKIGRVRLSAAGEEIVGDEETDLNLSAFYEAQLQGIRVCYDKITRGELLEISELQSVVNAFLRVFERGANPLRFLSFLRAADEYTYTHVANVFILTTSLAEATGLSGSILIDIGTAALLHDMGKMFVPNEVLNKTARLTGHEWKVMQTHTVRGAAYLLDVDDMPQVAMLGALEHHIRYDQAGYPRLGDGYMPHPVSRMISIADAFDAMRSSRIYQKAKAMDYILEVFEKERGKAFDPELTDIFLHVLSRE